MRSHTAILLGIQRESLYSFHSHRRARLMKVPDGKYIIKIKNGTTRRMDCLIPDTFFADSFRGYVHRLRNGQFWAAGLHSPRAFLFSCLARTGKFLLPRLSPGRRIIQRLRVIFFRENGFGYVKTR